MSWLCLNCETVNFDAEPKCIVCGEERYYSASEVRQLLENHPETKSLREQNKKLNTQNKWLQTRNKNLTQENKQLQADLEYQARATPSHQENLFEKAPEINETAQKNELFEAKIKHLQKQWKRKVLIWQVGTLVASSLAVLVWVFKK